ncbi:hypothetical protein AFCA_002890 [Aspergillus flavus]|nr:hypothetical protein AFLA_012746 [Aspergillus flavus NRRL3357]UDD55254.1 hypothetical protein AFCA_002890 [Aspergillus flavus]
MNLFSILTLSALLGMANAVAVTRDTSSATPKEFRRAVPVTCTTYVPLNNRYAQLKPAPSYFFVKAQMTALESALRLILILLLKTLDWIHRNITDDPDNAVWLATVASTWLWLEPALMVMVAWMGGLYWL